MGWRGIGIYSSLCVYVSETILSETLELEIFCVETPVVSDSDTWLTLSWFMCQIQTRRPVSSFIPSIDDDDEMLVAESQSCTCVEYSI